MHQYSPSVAWSPEDNMYVAVCPEFNNLMALAETEVAAVRELKTAIALVLEDMKEAGEIFPKPQTHPTHSGQFRVRIPKILHAKLVIQAGREGVSLNTLVNMFLTESSANLSAAEYIGRPLKSSIPPK